MFPAFHNGPCYVQRAWWRRRARLGEAFVTLFGKRIALAIGAVSVAAAAFACGGDDDTGPDDEYVTAFCDAQRAFSDSLETALDNASSSSDFDEVAEPYETLAEDFGDMKPPEDVQDWHDDVTDQLDGIADRVREEGNLDAHTELEQDPTTGMPDEPRQRLLAIAEEDPACEGLTVFR